MSAIERAALEPVTHIPGVEPDGDRAATPRWRRSGRPRPRGREAGLDISLDLVAETSLAMTSEANAHDVLAAVHPQPTLSEVMHEASGGAGRSRSYLTPRPRKGFPAPRGARTS